MLEALTAPPTCSAVADRVEPVARLESWARVLGVVIALAGSLSLFGAISGLGYLSRWSHYRAAMAPNTALCFITLGVLLARGERIQGRFDMAASFLVAVLALARMTELTLDRDLFIDTAARHLLPGLFRAESGIMSFFTAFCFCVAVGARWLRDSARPVSFFLSSLVGTVGLVFLLGYLYGNPLHYNGSIVPLAANTAAGFVLLSAGQIFWSVAQTRRQHLDQEGRIQDLTVTLRSQVVELQATNRKLREAQASLIQAEKMNSLGGLVAGIAHEINNPLAFVTSNLHTIGERLDRLEPHLTESERKDWLKARQRTSDSAQGVGRIADLVVKLRQFSRLDLTSREAFDVREGLDAALLMLKHRTDGRIRVVREYGSPPLVWGHPAHLNQVFLDLLTNAAEAIRGEGTIRVTLQVADGALEILIRDSGVGIDPEIQNKVYDPFFTTKPVGAGSGLGLSSSYSIVESHRGRLSFRSQLDPGTEFTVRLPLRSTPRG